MGYPILAETQWQLYRQRQPLPPRRIPQQITVIFKGELKVVQPLTDGGRLLVALWEIEMHYGEAGGRETMGDKAVTNAAGASEARETTLRQRTLNGVLKQNRAVVSPPCGLTESAGY